jgi:hypothetical protein
MPAMRKMFANSLVSWRKGGSSRIFALFTG